MRDISSSYEGAIQVFITDTAIGETELAKSLKKMKLDGFNFNRIGILEYPYFDENPAKRIATIAYIYGPNKIKLVKTGIYDFDIVK